MSYYSFVNYTADGDTVNYTIPFPYLYTTHIKVYVQGILKSSGTHYSFLNASTIQFTSAPLENEIITIKRESGRDARLVDFQTGSLLKEEDLDKDSTQLFYLMQEAFDALTIASNEDGDIFTSPEAILSAITGSVDVEHLVSSLSSPIGYWDQIHDNDAIYEFNEDGTSVYDHGVMGDGDARITIAEAAIEAVVTDTSGHTAQLALMADEFYVKLDANNQVCGFGLYNGDTSSSFVVSADKFAVMATSGEGDPIVPFVIDTETGLVAISGNLLVTGSITGTKIAAGTVEASNIKAATIEASNIKLGTITAAQIAENTISANRIIEGAITGTYISNNAISTDHILANAITGGKIAAGEIDTDHLAALSISTAKLQVGSVDDTIIANGAVTTQKVYAGAITATHIGTNEIIANAANIKDAVITGGKIGNLQVDTLQLKGNAVTVPVSAYTAGTINCDAGSNPGVTIQSVTLTVSGNNPVFINCSFMVEGADSHYHLLRGSTYLYSADAYYTEDIYENTIPVPHAFSYTDTPSGGTYTYYLKVNGGSSTNATCRSLFAMEVKK